jgi:hypothetical protein
VYSFSNVKIENLPPDINSNKQKPQPDSQLFMAHPNKPKRYNDRLTLYLGEDKEETFPSTCSHPEFGKLIELMKYKLDYNLEWVREKDWCHGRIFGFLISAFSVKCLTMHFEPKTKKYYLYQRRVYECGSSECVQNLIQDLCCIYEYGVWFVNHLGTLEVKNQAKDTPLKPRTTSAAGSKTQSSNNSNNDNTKNNKNKNGKKDKAGSGNHNQNMEASLNAKLQDQIIHIQSWKVRCILIIIPY